MPSQSTCQPAAGMAVGLRPAEVALRWRCGRRTNDREPVGTNAVTHILCCSAFPAAPRHPSRAATAPIVKDFDIGLVRQSTAKGGEESFVAGLHDEEFSRHASDSQVHAPRQRAELFRPLRGESTGSVLTCLWRNV